MLLDYGCDSNGRNVMAVVVMVVMIIVRVANGSRGE